MHRKMASQLGLGYVAVQVLVMGCSGSEGVTSPPTGAGGGTASSSSSSLAGQPGVQVSGGTATYGSSSPLANGGTSSLGGNTSGLGAGGSLTNSGGATGAGGASATSNGGTTSAGGSKALGGTTSAGGSKALGGTTSAGGSKALGGTTSAGGASSTGGTVVTGTPCAGLIVPPAPPTAGAAQPSASVTAPNLKVLPWAGFKGAVSYTFDDSQPSQMEHMAALKATGVPMTFFVNASAKWQTNFDADWAAAAAAGMELGDHTYSHCQADLVGCTGVGDQAAEIDQNRSYIMSHLKVSGVYSFAAPFGNTGWNTWVKPRYFMDRGVVGGMIAATGPTDWYNLPVYGVSAGNTAVNFNAAIDSARSANSWVIFMYHSILPTTQNWTAGVEIADITASVAHAKSFGDVWFDAMGTVAAYSKGKQLLEALGANATSFTWTLPENFPPHRALRVTVAGGKLSQNGIELAWDPHGYYEVCLDAGKLSWNP